MGKIEAMSFKTSASIGRSFALIGTAAASMGVAVEGAFAAMVVKSENLVFSYNKMAAASGVSIESFSKLAYVSKMAGVPVEQTSVILTRVSKSSLAAASGNQKLAALYKSLGVATLDANGHLRNSGDIFQDLAVALSKYSDEGKSGILQQLAGRSGSQVNSMMKLMAQSATELGKEAAKLGVIFTTDQVAAATKLHVAITNLEEVGLGFAVKLSTAVVPALDKVAEKILVLATNADTLKTIESIGAGIGTSLAALANVFVFLAEHIKGVSLALGGLVGLRIAGMFIPMIVGATEASGVWGKLGLAALRVGTSFLGIRRATDMAIAGVKGTSQFIGPLLEGEVRASKFSLALKALGTSLAGLAVPALMLVGLAAVAVGVWAVIDASKHLKEAGADWSDVWLISVGRVAKAFDDLKHGHMPHYSEQSAIDEAQGLGDKGKAVMGQSKFNGTPSGWNVKAAGASTEADYKKYLAEQEKLKLGPPAPKEDTAAEKIIKRLAEIKIKAEEAQAALDSVGKNPQQLRNAEIDALSKKFNVENSKATGAQMAQARAGYTDEINKKAAAEYGNEIVKQTRTTDLATQAQLAMTAAMHGTAQQMQAASVAAQVASEFGQKSPDWRTDPKMSADAAARTIQLTKASDVAMAQSNQAAIDGLSRQQFAQENLNAAIMQGSKATEAAQLVNLESSTRNTEHDAGNTDDASIQSKVDGAKLVFQQTKDAEDLRKAAALDAKQQFEDQRQSIIDIAKAAEDAGHALDHHVILELNKANMATFNSSMDKATLASGSAMEGMQLYFRQMGRNVESGAQQMHTVLTGVFTSLNDTMSELMVNQKNNFASFFKGIADQLSHLALQKFEMGIIQSLGNRFGTQDKDPNNPHVKKDSGGIIGTGVSFLSGLFGGKDGAKPGSSAGNPMFVSVVASAASGLSGILGAAGSGGSSSSSASGLIGSILTMAPLVGFAGGGAVEGGVPITVGEMGSETFVPNQNGTIVPHNKANSGTTYDFRGADFTGTNASETQAKIRDAMIQTHSQAVRDSVAVRQDQNKRSPSSRRQ